MASSLAGWLCSSLLAVMAQKPPPGTIVDGDLGMRLDNAVTQSAATFWGAVLVAVNGKPVLAKGYGLADRVKVPMAVQCLFDLGGAAQQLTVLAALRAVADKQLRLEDPVGKFLAEWPMERSGMTVFDLVKHTSGYPAVLPWTANAAQNARAATAFFAKTAMAGRIGADSLMSPANGNLLALVLESSGQQRFEKTLLERACRPAGMTTAMPLGQRGDQKLMTARRSPQNERGEPADKAEWTWAHKGARGVLVSVLDMHALLAALVGDKLLTPEARAILWRPLAGDSYGVTELPGNGETMVRVHGHTTGYRARWLVQPSTRSWLVILTEDYGATDVVEAAVAAQAWQAAAAASAPAVTAPPATNGAAATNSGGAFSPAELERFAGTYELPRGGGAFRIEQVGGKVQIVGFGLQASARLLAGRWPPPGEDRLRRAEDRGLAFLQRVLADDKAVDEDGFESAGVGKSARDEMRTWVQQNGKPKKVQYVGTTPAGHGESWFRLLGAGGETFVRAAWNARGEFVRCSVSTEPLPFAVPLAAAGADTAVGTLANGMQIVLTMEGSKERRVLVFEDETPGDDGLLDCPILPPGS